MHPASMLHLDAMSPSLLRPVIVSYSRLGFHDLDTLEGYWSGVCRDYLVGIESNL